MLNPALVYVLLAPSYVWVSMAFSVLCIRGGGSAIHKHLFRTSRLSFERIACAHLEFINYLTVVHIVGML